MRAAERVFNHRETPEEKKSVRGKEREFRAEENRKNQKELAQIFFAGVRQGANSQGTSKVRPRDKRKRLRKDQCAYCQERGHWRRECPKKNWGKSPPGKKHLPWGPTSYMQEMITIGGGCQGSVPVPESWVTIHVEEKLVGFMVDTGAQYSVLTPRQVREFLETAGYCRLWILGFAEKTWPLYEGSKESKNWTWTEPVRQAFQELRQALLKALALALPNPSKPFQLFVDKKLRVGKGVLMQQCGPWKRPVAYLSKRLDPIAAGWPPCLRIIAATALLVHDADKLTYGQQLLVYTPHAIEGILKQPSETVKPPY